METDNNGDSWKIWRKHIIAEIARLSNNQEVMTEKTTAHLLITSVEISRLKIYAAIIGAVSGGFVSLLASEVIRRW